jgi:hypothetical protein
MDRERRQVSGFRVTERDQEIVRWLGRVKLATVEQVRVRIGMGRTKAYERLAGLVASGLVIHERGVPGHGVYLASKQGLQLAGLGLTPATVSLGALRHDLAVAGVVAELERASAGIQLLTEREIRAHVAETGDETFRTHVQQRGVGTSRHWPDLVLLTGGLGTPGWLAIEIELQRKGARRLKAILAGYDTANLRSTARTLWGVLYLVPGAPDARRVTGLAAELAMGPGTLPVSLFAAPLGQEGGAVAAIRELARVHDRASQTRRGTA